jgi:Uncharacterised protein family (UPF0158)
MAAVKYDDLIEAIDFVSAGASSDHQAFIALDTGRIYWISEFGDPIDEDVPEDLDESDRYLEVPSRNDLDLGRRLVFRFVEEQLPGAYEQVQGFFSRRGAYGRFKALLEDAGCLDKWRQFDAQCTRQALEDWCEAHAIELIPSEYPSA